MEENKQTHTHKSISVQEFLLREGMKSEQTIHWKSLLMTHSPYFWEQDWTFKATSFSVSIS